MRLLDFFKTRFTGIFVDNAVNGKGAFDSVKVDYVLSRSLYASVPADNSGYMQYALGNYCTKTYIDTLSSFIGLPDVQAESDSFTADVQKYLSRNKTALLRIYRQTMIDGEHFVWARIENTLTGKAELRLKQIPLELVVQDECIPDSSGGYKRFVFEQTKKWKERGSEKKAAIKIELEEGKETITVTGDLPPEYGAKKTETKNAFSFVPVFCLYNNKQTFLKGGVPEIAAAVPFIRRYDATLRKLGKHIDNILDPKMKVRAKNIDKFVQSSFGLTPEQYSKILAGEGSVDITQFKAAMLEGENDTVDFITQQDNTQSTIELLKLLHWIIIELTMPEYLYGTAMNSTSASVKEQSPVWTKKIEDRQGEYNEFYYWLVEVYALASTAIHGRDVYAKDGGTENAVIRWQELTAKDDVVMMNALSTFVGAMDKALNMGLVSPKSAFNTLKIFMAIPADFETEQEAAQKWIKFKMNLEALQDRIRSGDTEAGEAVDGLFNA